MQQLGSAIAFEKCYNFHAHVIINMIIIAKVRYALPQP